MSENSCVWLQHQGFSDDVCQSLVDLRARNEKLKRAAELVAEDRFCCEYKGKAVVTHGRFFAIEHRLENSDVCPICAALDELAKSC
jgi:hypothetical protein